MHSLRPLLRGSFARARPSGGGRVRCGARSGECARSRADGGPWRRGPQTVARGSRRRGGRTRRRAVAAGFDAGAQHPAGEAIGVVVAPRGALLPGGHPAKLGRPQHQRVVQQASLPQVGQAARPWADRRSARDGRSRPAAFLCASQFKQAIDPRCPRSTVQVDVPHAPLEQPAGQQAVLGRTSRLERDWLVLDAILPRWPWPTRPPDPSTSGARELHLGGQLVGCDPRGQVC